MRCHVNAASGYSLHSLSPTIATHKSPHFEPLSPHSRQHFITMMPSCNHDKLQCAHKATWPRWTQPETWDSYRLALECRGYEESQKQAHEMIRRYCQPEPLTDNETEVDPEEAEDEMNNLPSPLQTHSRFWTTEYQAQREARKRLWSPPLTPPLPGMPTHSLQPSQRDPPSRRRHRQSSPARNRPKPSSPSTSPHIQLQLPPKGRHNRIRKTQPSPRPHRPTTRSMKYSKLLSLHSRRGLVNVTSATGQGHSVTFEQCLKDGISWFVLSLPYLRGPFVSCAHLAEVTSAIAC